MSNTVDMTLGHETLSVVAENVPLMEALGWTVAAGAAAKVAPSAQMDQAERAKAETAAAAELDAVIEDAILTPEQVEATKPRTTRTTTRKR